MCIVGGCRRTPPRGQTICGACYQLVPVETKLALIGHGDAWSASGLWGIPRADRETWQAFVVWSYQQTMQLAAEQAFIGRQERALDAIRALSPDEGDAFSPEGSEE
jgi:hypothetical protein